MNILSAVLPGLREMRTPLAVGALWLVVGALIAAKWWDALLREVPGASALIEVVTLRELSATVPVIAAATFLAYLLGCGINPLSTWYAGLISQAIDRFVVWTRPANRAHRLTRIVARIEAPRERRESIVRDVVNGEYARKSLPLDASNAFEWRLVDRELESLSMQLWSQASDQYQEYDRVRAERAFRAGVSLPLIIVGMTASFTVVWWLGVPLIALSVVLAVQARFLEDEQRELMANALRARLVTSPLLDRVVTMIADENSADVASWAQWNALTAVMMDRIGYLGDAGEAYERAMWTVIDGVDLAGTNNWRLEVERRGGELARLYRAHGNREFAVRMVADIEFRCDRVEAEKRTPIADRAADPLPANQLLTQHWYGIAPAWGGAVIPPELAPYYPHDSLHPRTGAGGK